MIIKKELKNAAFEYNEETKSFTLSNSEVRIELNKVYAFAFMRFVVRMAQKNWLIVKKKLDKLTENVIQSDQFNHPDQMEFL